MLPDPVSNPGPLTYESGALSIALRGPACSRHEMVVVLPSQCETKYLLCKGVIFVNLQNT